MRCRSKALSSFLCAHTGSLAVRGPSRSEDGCVPTADKPERGHKMAPDEFGRSSHSIGETRDDLSFRTQFWPRYHCLGLSLRRHTHLVRLLLVACCWLLAVGCLLLVDYRWLVVVGGLLLVAYC